MLMKLTAGGIKRTLINTRLAKIHRLEPCSKNTNARTHNVLHFTNRLKKGNVGSSVEIHKTS